LGSLVVAVLFLVLADPAAQTSPASNPTPSVTSSPCLNYGYDAGKALTWPPPVLPAGFVARYPDGVSMTIAVDVNASGHVRSVKLDAGESYSNAKSVAHDLAGALGTFVNSWVRAATFSPPVDQCRSQAGTVEFDMTFLPAVSGITARPPIVGGVNFDEMTYKPGPCSTQDIQDTDRLAPVTMHLGEYDYSTSGGMDIRTAVSEVFAGSVGGVTISVVPLVCHAAGGYTIEARVYRAEAGVATYLGSVGILDHPSADAPIVENDWIHTAFSGGLLYVDAWVYDMRCKANDWAVSTYSIRSDKLVLLHKEMHHRSSTPRACD
jgi:hypothetical protein